MRCWSVANTTAKETVWDFIHCENIFFELFSYSSMWQKKRKQALHFSNKGNLKLCVNDEHKQNTKNKFKVRPDSPRQLRPTQTHTGRRHTPHEPKRCSLKLRVLTIHPKRQCQRDFKVHRVCTWTLWRIWSRLCSHPLWQIYLPSCSRVRCRWEGSHGAQTLSSGILSPGTQRKSCCNWELLVKITSTSYIIGDKWPVCMHLIYSWGGK